MVPRMSGGGSVSGSTAFNAPRAGGWHQAPVHIDQLVTWVGPKGFLSQLPSPPAAAAAAAAATQATQPNPPPPTRAVQLPNGGEERTEGAVGVTHVHHGAHLRRRAVGQQGGGGAAKRDGAPARPPTHPPSQHTSLRSAGETPALSPHPPPRTQTPKLSRTHTSRMECMASWGMPTSTVRTPSPLARMGPVEGEVWVGCVGGWVVWVGGLCGWVVWVGGQRVRASGWVVVGRQAGWEGSEHRTPLPTPRVHAPPHACTRLPAHGRAHIHTRAHTHTHTRARAPLTNGRPARHVAAHRKLGGRHAAAPAHLPASHRGAGRGGAGLRGGSRAGVQHPNLPPAHPPAAHPPPLSSPRLNSVAEMALVAYRWLALCLSTNPAPRRGARSGSCLSG